MARAATVWVVESDVHVGALAAFTVKHELVAWLRKMREVRGHLVGVRVARLPDGGTQPLQFPLLGPYVQAVDLLKEQETR